MCKHNFSHFKFTDFYVNVGSTPMILYVDCRWDSSRSGYHGTVPVIDVATGKVVELVTIDRVEAGNSNSIEPIGIRRAFERLHDAGIHINEVVHDDNNTVDRILREFHIDNHSEGFVAQV